MLYFIFRPKNIIDADQEDWIVNRYRWLIDNIGFGNGSLNLITATPDFFGAPPKKGHERAQYIFDKIKFLMGVSDWPCVLQAQREEASKKVDEFLVIQNAPNDPLGTFRTIGRSEETKTAIITYNPKELGNTVSLIATLSHELSHYILGGCDTERPGGHSDEEPLTDLMSIASGFGLFLANSRFNFRQFQDFNTQGWEWSKSGYLNEPESVFALALFLNRNHLPTATLKQNLKPHLFTLLKKADAYIQRTDLVL